MINVMSTGLDRSSWHQHLWALGRLTLINLAGKKLARRFAKKPWTMGFHHLQKLPHPTDPPKNQQIDKILVSEWSLWGLLNFWGFCYLLPGPYTHLESWIWGYNGSMLTTLGLQLFIAVVKPKLGLSAYHPRSFSQNKHLYLYDILWSIMIN